MRHYTCDLCGETVTEDRFVVQMEVFATFDPDELVEADFEADHLQSVSETIDEIEKGEVDPPPDLKTQQLRFDLCAGCRVRFLDDPLGRDALRRLNFSEN